MKPTGIIRRVDDLGRVVIPKEIRRSLEIRENDPLEIYTDEDGSIIFRKYNPCIEYKARAIQMGQDILTNDGVPPEIREAAFQKVKELVALLGADVK